VYAVIFKAKIKKLSTDYQQTATRMRELALTKYGCIEFVSSFENDTEIAISYWKNLEQIQHWKHDKEHMIAQEKGKFMWYESYTIQVTEILREYNNS